MSVWKKFESNALKDTEVGYLEKALAEMKLGLDHSIKNISNTWGQEEVDMALTRNDSVLPLGFKVMQEGKHTNLELRGDFYATGLKEKTFMDNLSQKYQKERIKDKLELNGWTVDEEYNEETKKVELTAEQW